MALTADAAMQLLREAMEGLLVSDLVSRTIFDALGEYGGNLPQKGRELKTFVEGPLSRALVRRVDEDTRLAIVERLRPIVDSIIQSEIPPPSERAITISYDRDGLEEMPTRRRLTSSIPYVLVVAGSRGMERRLRLALGTTLGASTARGAVDIHTAMLAYSPRLIVIDASDPVDVSARELAQALARACADSLLVIWGSTRPNGAKLLGILATNSPPPIGLEEAEGVEPLLDLVRSHGMSFDPRDTDLPPPKHR